MSSCRLWFMWLINKLLQIQLIQFFSLCVCVCVISFRPSHCSSDLCSFSQSLIFFENKHNQLKWFEENNMTGKNLTWFWNWFWKWRKEDGQWHITDKGPLLHYNCNSVIKTYFSACKWGLWFVSDEEQHDDEQRETEKHSLSLH